jgi:hypothetical protein
MNLSNEEEPPVKMGRPKRNKLGKENVNSMNSSKMTEESKINESITSNTSVMSRRDRAKLL